MNRRDFLKMAGVGVAGLGIVRRSVAVNVEQSTFTSQMATSDRSNIKRRTMSGRRPNIIVILTDDQGYGDLGRNGNKVIKTPNLDRMYDEGFHYEDFHVSPTCAPTRSSIMSGKHEFKNGVTHTILERCLLYTSDAADDYSV